MTPPDLSLFPPHPGFPPSPPVPSMPIHPRGEAIGFVFGLVGGIVVWLAAFVYVYARMKPGSFWYRRPRHIFGDPLVNFSLVGCMLAGMVLGAFIGRAVAYYSGANH